MGPFGRRWRALLACALLAPLAIADAATSTGVLIPISGPIGPATSDFFVRELAAAQADGASLVVVTLDTPGGLDASMRDIVQAILACDVPVVTYVAPSGARAASAGRPNSGSMRMALACLVSTCVTAVLNCVISSAETGAPPRALLMDFCSEPR